MVTFITIIHVFVCIFLMLVVLLQAGKGGGMGVAFGSSTSSAVFGGRGAGSFEATSADVTCCANNPKSCSGR